MSNPQFRKNLSRGVLAIIMCILELAENYEGSTQPPLEKFSRSTERPVYRHRRLRSSSIFSVSPEDVSPYVARFNSQAATIELFDIARNGGRVAVSISIPFGTSGFQDRAGSRPGYPSIWRKRQDSNLRIPFRIVSLAKRCNRPLYHVSINGAPSRIRTRFTTLRGWRPKPNRRIAQKKICRQGSSLYLHAFARRPS